MNMPPLTAGERAEMHQTIADIATLKVRVEHITAALVEQKEVNRKQSAQLQTILDKLSEAKGGWRTLMLLGGAAAAFGGTMIGFAQYIAAHLPRIAP